MMLVGLVLGASGVRAQDLTIEITKGVEGALPVAVVPFGVDGPIPQDLSAIVSADLQRSGRIDVVSSESYHDRPTDVSQVNFPEWRSRQVDNLVVGQVRTEADGRFTVQFQLVDVLQGTQTMGYTFNVGGDELRRLAHRISDLVYERLTGERGAFDTRIAYIKATGQPGSTSYTLVVADSDGDEPQVILRSTEPLMSPAWSPDGNRLAYVSFENRKPEIIVQDVFTGERSTVASYPGINGAPAWSPDGRKLALTLSKDGSPSIYVHDLGTGSLTRLTHGNAIDTEPAWWPDGRSIVFTSDRGGSPQLYRIDSNGGQPARQTFDGNYNARASISPDGEYVAMVHRSGNKFTISVMNAHTREARIITEGSLDESPSFAPNGRMIIYATSRGGRGVLKAVSVDGRVEQSLVSRDSDVRDPAWSPYMR